MQVLMFPYGILAANCCLLLDDAGKDAVLIDPSAPPDHVLGGFSNPPRITHILLTHCHFDHIGYLRQWQELTSAPICIGADEADALTDPYINLTAQFHAAPPGGYPAADIRLSDGDKIGPPTLRLAVLHTPGHTAGSVCYHHEEGILFSGDTIFSEGSMGRTDFPTGNAQALQRSVARLMALPPQTKIYPGHGPVTTVHDELHFHAK